MLTMSAAAFAAGINSVIACASDDVTLPGINCVNVRWEAGEVCFTSTNRYVLAEQTVRVDLEGDAAGELTIPVPALKSALAVIKATKAETVTVTSGDVAGVAYRFDAEFPKIASLWPAESAHKEVGRIAFDPNLTAQLAGPKFRGKYPTLDFTFTGECKPILVRRQGGPAFGDSTEGFRALLMPIRPAA